MRISPTISSNNISLSQVNNNQLSSPPKSPPQKIIDTPELLIGIFKYLSPTDLKKVRLIKPMELAANAVIKSAKVHDIEELKGAINKFGPGGLHITFASDFNFLGDLAALLSDTGVTSLRFDRCSGLTDEHFTAFQSCTNLKALSLNACRRITGSFLQHIPATVKKLVVSDAPLLTDEHFTALQQCNNLEELSLYTCEGLKGSFLQHIPATVKKLVVSYCPHLTDEHFTALQQCNNLEELTFSECEGLRGSSLQHIPATVKKLVVSECPNLTDIDFTIIKKKYPNLILIS